LSFGVSVCVRSFVTIFHVTDGGSIRGGARGVGGGDDESQRTHFVIDKTAVTNGFAKTRKSSPPSKQQHGGCEETRKRQFLIITPRAF
jgi:hypothetical protein